VSPNLDLKQLLEKLYRKYNCVDFIREDPISIPHRYSRKEDIEITGLWTAILAWGNRRTIINKAQELFSLMDNSPYDFITNHLEIDRVRFQNWKHRTFQYTDTLYFLHFFQWYYQRHLSLETAFIDPEYPDDLKKGLIHFKKVFFSLPDYPQRTKKHISSPASKSTCKRINMFLRWMVRSDQQGVDFGIWNKIKAHQLFIPYDVHVERIARELKLTSGKQRNWQAVEQLTNRLKKFDEKDPVKYDFALFGLGVINRNNKTIFPLPV